MSSAALAPRIQSRAELAAEFRAGAEHYDAMADSARARRNTSLAEHYASLALRRRVRAAELERGGAA